LAVLGPQFEFERMFYTIVYIDALA